MQASPPLAVSLLRFGVPDETEQQSEDVTLIAQEGLGGQLEGLGLRV